MQIQILQEITKHILALKVRPMMEMKHVAQGHGMMEIIIYGVMLHQLAILEYSSQQQIILQHT